MTMDRTMPLVIAVLYAATAVGCIAKKDYAMATMWLCYSIANVAVVIACWNR